MKEVPNDQLMWLGVAKYAPEFALISKRIIEVSGGQSEESSIYLQCTPHYELQVFHDFILEQGLGRDANCRQQHV